MAKLGRLDPNLLIAVTVTSYIVNGTKSLKLIDVMFDKTMVSLDSTFLTDAELSEGSIR